jgi:site-specific recombinase XerD
VDALLRAFLEHLTGCRGLSTATCTQQGRHVREFLTAQFPSGAVDIDAISARDLMTFVAARAATGQSRTAKCVGTALRGFLRFLVLQGKCAAELVRAVPAVAHRGARLPRALRLDQVRHLLSNFDRSKPVGCRDHAIALCLVRLGLRCSEVVDLRLDDIAWRDGVLRLPRGKSRRAATMPLPVDVGRAVARYIQDARPATTDRHVFLSHVVPVGAPLAADAARAAMRRAFDRAKLEVVSKGTHSLRHTLATRMICEGSSLKEVADVLRHRSLDTSVLYARVDLPGLRSVVMPWPAVCS